MKNMVEVSAKTLDEAVLKGCTELGVGLDEVDFEVVSDGGLFRKMTVQVRLKNAVAATPNDTESQKTTAVDPISENSPISDKKSPKTSPKATVQVEAGEVEEFEIGGGTKRTAAAKKVKEARPVTEFDENCPKFTKTRAFTEQLFALLGDGLSVTASHDDHEYLLEVSGNDVGRLIGKNGHTLAAINTIVSSIAVNTHSGEPRRVVVDVANYREQRKENLIALAKRKAEQVKRTGKAVRLDPMPARERVVVHLALQDVEGIITESEGVEPHRFLVIKPGAR